MIGESEKDAELGGEIVDDDVYAHWYVVVDDDVYAQSRPFSRFEGVESRGGVSRPRGVAAHSDAPVGSKPICTVPNIYVAEVPGV